MRAGKMKHRIASALATLGAGLFALSCSAQTPQALSDAALARTQHSVVYDGSYRKLRYPGGDVAANKGVCTDVVIRAYRSLGIDLQKEVHEDIRANFTHYPSKRIWGMQRPDTNIDHRRVPNLQTFFTRKGQSLAVSHQPSDYQPGDIVTWMLANNLPHIGIVVNKKSTDGQRFMVVHNIGLGPKLDDMLFDYTITGHYRYFPLSPAAPSE